MSPRPSSPAEAQRRDLAPFGWAPGFYAGGTCRDCSAALPPHAKRAHRCAACAEAAAWEAARAMSARHHHHPEAAGLAAVTITPPRKEAPPMLDRHPQHAPHIADATLYAARLADLSRIEAEEDAAARRTLAEAMARDPATVALVKRHRLRGLVRRALLGEAPARHVADAIAALGELDHDAAPHASSA